MTMFSVLEKNTFHYYGVPQYLKIPQFAPQHLANSLPKLQNYFIIRCRWHVSNMIKFDRNIK